MAQKDLVVLGSFAFFGAVSSNLIVELGYKGNSSTINNQFIKDSYTLCYILSTAQGPIRHTIISPNLYPLLILQGSNENFYNIFGIILSLSIQCSFLWLPPLPQGNQRWKRIISSWNCRCILPQKVSLFPILSRALHWLANEHWQKRPFEDC